MINRKQEIQNKHSIEYLEGVKFLAIVWIAWYHIYQLKLPHDHGIWNILTIPKLGFTGVSIFLFLSGFGLTFSITKIKNNEYLTWKNLPWKNFFIKRSLRIYPLYIIALLFFLITGILMGKYDDMPLNVGFILSILGIRTFFPEYFFYGPDAFWFISLILQFYLLFPLLLRLLYQKGHLIFLLIVFAVYACSRIITTNSEFSYYYMLGFPTNRLAEFCLGMSLGYSTINKQKISLKNFNINNPYFLCISLLSFIFTYFIYFKTNSNTSFIKIIFDDILLGISSFNMIVIFLLIIRNIQSFLYKLIIFLGGISYAFYLFHSPPIRPIFAIFNKLGINNLIIVSMLYLLIVIYTSYVITYIDKKIYEFISAKFLGRIN